MCSVLCIASSRSQSVALRRASLNVCNKCARRVQGATTTAAGFSGRYIADAKLDTSKCFANAPPETIHRCELSTAVARKCLLIEALVSQDRQHIIITGVRQESPAWEAGIRPGDELVGISDPNLDTVWEFDEMTSLRFVKDALRMRIPDTVTMLLNKNPPQFVSAAGATADKPNVQVRKPSALHDGDSDLLDAVLSSVESDDSDTEASSSGKVASDLERQYRRMQAEKTRSTQRIQARKAALSTVGERNDAPFFLTIVAVFLGPPLLILIWAFSSGYLDSLSSKY